MTEDRIQYEVFKWANDNRHDYPCLTYLHHCPNGGRRDARTAARLVSLGVRRGVPDIFLPFPCNGFHGLYIELKTEKGKTSPDQDRWIEYLESVNYKVHVCRSSDAAIKVILDYLI